MRDSQYNIVSSTQVKIGRKIKTHFWNLDFILVFLLSLLKWTNINQDDGWRWGRFGWFSFFAPDPTRRCQRAERMLAPSPHKPEEGQPGWAPKTPAMPSGSHQSVSYCGSWGLFVCLSVCLAEGCKWVASQCPPCAFYGSLTSCQHVKPQSPSF